MTVRRKDSARSARSRHSSSVRSLLSSAIRPPGSGPAPGETRSSTPAVCPGVEHLSAAYTHPHGCALCEQSVSRCLGQGLLCSYEFFLRCLATPDDLLGDL